ncbi:MAG: hypothetical protein A2W52_00465 [Candidatus Taylorbacteria bacterium RIFCSPHIGHO2_02_49_25]|uniref:TraC-like domain-containing protein n=1 Tax=Candidatus Taylorbacteria bacterium RIFCSPHIGHO2_02_49_25 TaxID=1802305 RepID=A0A1G2MIT9_9BACT|nr:MAG: hypothetical protein UY62_C0009G0016 [Parcubacteria group bacterium GW2011_GWF2_50_9]OHA20690.1 MAG: hypothetical protein A2759_03705 [Candidatus Taylorbacteria bacterium RIFCSPHIGHO2_01_FULL_49_60]OHA23069.1 MAG: hypothetical protein A2W52_00465 [Candidatus Taylorbacteria bacterium RIFCSPHIGHO2_02_49_25]OHA36571.1 MAG: hypothetical protein A3B27_03295 [Candidatus Taylorbacteria bacterium RIFCSPLOWO2_01_FULL_50_130]OHA36817.1 MAG: hypothetical protein A2W65_00120 [Candidatus Taylorbacte
MAIAAKASQDFVKIQEIRDGIVILKSGDLRAVLMTSSINFALKSEENQRAIIEQFQNFLNALTFSVEIVVQSRRFDIKPYLKLLGEREEKQKNELLRLQTREYIGFVKKFTDSTNVMNKTFFVVVPYSPAIVEVHAVGGSLAMKIKEGFGKKHTEAERTHSFEESRTQLEQRVAIVEQGLLRTGIRVAQLGTEEVVDVFYQLFNPGEAEKTVQEV